MPRLPFRRRPSDPTETEQLDQLLRSRTAGLSPTADSVAGEWRDVAAVLKAAAASATRSELAGKDTVLAAFRRAGLGATSPATLVAATLVPEAPVVGASAGWAAMRRLRATSGRVAAAVTVAVLGIGGATSAAFADALPRPIQSLAHDVIGAPRPHSTQPQARLEPTAGTSPSESPTASHTQRVAPALPPSATSTARASVSQPGIAGLCQAWSEARSHGSTADAALLAQLAAAAGGADRVDTLCAGVAAAGQDAGNGNGNSSGSDAAGNHGQDGSGQQPDQHSDQHSTSGQHVDGQSGDNHGEHSGQGQSGDEFGLDGSNSDHVGNSGEHSGMIGQPFRAQRG